MAVTGWHANVTLHVEVDFSQLVGDANAPDPAPGSNLWDYSTWDTSIWNDGPTWTDVTADVRGISTDMSFSRQTNNYNTARATITLSNLSGNYSPTNTSGTHYGYIGLLRPIRVWMEYTSGFGWGTTTTLFTGLIQSWDETFPEFGHDAVVTVEALGLDSRLAQFENVAQAAVGAGETSGARIQRILNAAGWSGNSYLDAGLQTMQATTLEGSAKSLLQSTADAEGGAFYFDADGNAVFDAFDAQVNKYGRSNPFGVVFTDQPGAGCTYRSIDFSDNADLVRNIVTYSNTGGVAQTVDWRASRSLYGDRSTVVTNLAGQSDSHAFRLADRDIQLLRNPEHRVESLTFSPLDSTNDVPASSIDNSYGWLGSGGTYDASPGYYAWMAIGSLALRVGADVRLTPPNQTEIQHYVFVEGLSHQITPDTWTTTVTFSSATAYAGISRWDASTWDSNAWSW